MDAWLWNKFVINEYYTDCIVHLPEWTIHGVKALFPREAPQVYQPAL